MIAAILSWLKGAIIPAAMAATLLGPVDYRAINGVTGALSFAPTTGAFTQAACAGLSNGGTACAKNTGTSGATVPLLNGTNVWTGQQSITPTIPVDQHGHLHAGRHIEQLHDDAGPCVVPLHAREPVGHSGRRHRRPDRGHPVGHRLGHDRHLGLPVSRPPAARLGLTLSTGANAVDILSYYVRDATHIELSLLTNFSH